MTLLGLFFSFLLKGLVLLVPLCVAILAFRRLTMSQSANAWLYAAAALYSVLTTLGILPWALWNGTSHPVFFFFAAMTPAIWLGVVSLCNASRSTSYDTELERTFARLARLVRDAPPAQPLILEEPIWPDAPMPVFRHRGAPERTEPRHSASSALARASEATRTLLEIARSMRGHATSDRRRIKLLPPPRKADPGRIPFLKPGNSA